MGGVEGTCFGASSEGSYSLPARSWAVRIDGRQYLITAKHVVANLKDEDSVDIRKGDAWQPAPFRVLRCREPIDIAVLSPRAQLKVSFAFDPSNKFFFGQDVYFVGFPYGLATDGKNVNGAFPVAFMKRGIISANRPELTAENKVLVVVLVRD